MVMMIKNCNIMWRSSGDSTSRYMVRCIVHHASAAVGNSLMFSYDITYHFMWDCWFRIFPFCDYFTTFFMQSQQVEGIVIWLIREGMNFIEAISNKSHGSSCIFIIVANKVWKAWKNGEKNLHGIAKTQTYWHTLNWKLVQLF